VDEIQNAKRYEGIDAMKKMLILNGSHSEIPLILEAKKLGYYTVTTGNNKGLIGHRYSDEYIYGDYSDKDEMLHIAKDQKVDAVCSCANDFGAISASYVAEKLGLPGHDSYKTALLLHQQDNFKVFAKENRIQTPMADIFTDLKGASEKKDACKYPKIVKPVDLTGGKGVSVVTDASEYMQAVRKALNMSRKGKAVVEDYIKGTYHSFSTFLVNRKVVAFFSDNEYPYLNPYFVATSGGPARNVDKVKGILLRQAELIAKKLSLVNGVFHMQYVMGSDLIPYIIDITRRCSGDIYVEPVEHATGIPWAKWIVMSEAGFPGSAYTERGCQQKYCGRHCIMARQNGRIQKVEIADELEKNIYSRIYWWKKGDIVSNYLVDKLGIVFLEYGSEEEMIEKSERIGSLIKVFVE